MYLTTKNIKLGKNLLCVVMALLLCMAMSSCNDSDLAEALKGTWLSDEMEFTESDGSKFVQQTYYEFTKTDDVIDGGKFYEEVSGTFTAGDEGLVLTGTVVSRVTGTWDVTMGELYLTYDLSSLTVDVDDASASLADDADEDAQWAFMDAQASGEFDKASLKKELRNMAYGDLKSQYQTENDEDDPYSDLKVEDNVMSFKTSDIGVMKFRKISD